MIPPDDAVREAASLWLIWSNEHGAWWGKAHHGYTREVAKAGRYSLAEAAEICEEDNVRGRNVEPPETMIRAPESRSAALAGVAGGGAEQRPAALAAPKRLYVPVDAFGYFPGEGVSSLDCNAAMYALKNQKYGTVVEYVRADLATPPAPLDAQDHGGPLPAPPVSPVAPAFEDVKHLFGGADVTPASKQVAQAAHGKGEASKCGPCPSCVETGRFVAAITKYAERVFQHGVPARERLAIDALAVEYAAPHAPPALAGATGASVEEVARVLRDALPGRMFRDDEPLDEDYYAQARAVLARLGATGEKSNG